MKNLPIFLGITAILVLVCFPVAAQAQSVAEQRICRQRGRYVVFAQHPLSQGAWGRGGLDGNRPNSPVGDRLNVEIAHEQIFFCNNGRVVDNIGFGPTGRFKYPEEAIRTGREASGERVDNFVPIDSERYDPEIVKIVLAGGTAVLPNRCEFRTTNYGIYGGVVNNCQGWTARVREEYWRKMFIGTWIANGYECPRGTKHTEKINITVNGNSLVATKIESRGDRCVPSGSRTFFGSIPSNVSRGSSFSVTFVGGYPNNPASSTNPDRLTIIDANTFSSGGESVTFRGVERR
jgi:hypothetical protein